MKLKVHQKKTHRTETQEHKSRLMKLKVHLKKKHRTVTQEDRRRLMKLKAHLKKTHRKVTLMDLTDNICLRMFYIFIHQNQESEYCR